MAQAQDRLPIQYYTIEGVVRAPDEQAVIDLLVELDDILADSAEDLFDEYVRGYPTDSEEPIPLIDKSHDRFVVAVSVEKAESFVDQLGDIAPRFRDAILDIHRKAAMKAGADPDRIEEQAALVLWLPSVYQYQDAGLSFQQARVRTCNDAGLQPSGIAEELDMEVGTVKSHLYRANQKIEQCEQLLDIASPATAEVRLLFIDTDTIRLQRRSKDDASGAVKDYVDVVDEDLRNLIEDEFGLEVVGGQSPKEGDLDHEVAFSSEIPQG